MTALSTYEQTVQRLGTAIRIGLLPPGTRLPPERELATQLGISRSTLRQAIAALARTGHVTAQRGRTGGTFVTTAPPLASGVVPLPSRDMLDWRMTLELGLVGLAAERATDEQRARLEAAALDTVAEEDWPGFRRRDAHFHLLLAETARSARGIEEMTRIQGDLSELLAHTEHPRATRAASAEQHREIAAAVTAGDPVAACRAMREHLALTERALAVVVASQEPRFSE